MQYSGTITARLSEKLYEVNVPDISPTLRAYDIYPNTAYAYEVGQGIVVGKVRYFNTEFYTIIGAVPKLDTAMPASNGSVSSFGNFSTLFNFSQKVLKDIVDFCIYNPNSHFPSLIGFWQGSLLMYASPRNYLLMTRLGETMLSCYDWELSGCGFIEKSIHNNISDVTDDLSMWKMVMGNLATKEKAFESMTGYIANQTSLTAKTGRYGYWVQIGDFIISVSSDGKFLTVDTMNENRAIKGTNRFGVEISSTGIDAYWGAVGTQKMHIGENNIKMIMSPSEIDMTPSEIKLNAPRVDIKCGENFLSLGANHTILGGASGILLGGDLDIQKNVVYNETGAYVITPSIEYITGRGVNFKRGLMANYMGLVDENFLNLGWDTLLKDYAVHVHPTVTGTTSPPTSMASALLVTAGMLMTAKVVSTEL